jgi:enoyl-[acyl-carrier protein] reductase I
VLLEDKKLLITGVLTPQSIAFAAARAAQEQGAEIVLTNFGRTVSLTQKTAKRLPSTPDVLEMDINEPDQIAAVCEELRGRWGRLDGFLHAIAFAPQDALGGNFLNTEWDSVATAIKTSAFSLKALATGMLPLMESEGGAIVSLDFDGQVAWPIYDWMGVAKAALEGVSRYLARDLGPKQIRVNTVSAGPLKTMAGKGIPGSTRSPRRGAAVRPSAGISPTPHRSATRWRSCCPTWLPASPARSCTWTAGSTRWGPTWRSDHGPGRVRTGGCPLRSPAGAARGRSPGTLSFNPLRENGPNDAGST